VPILQRKKEGVRRDHPARVLSKTRNSQKLRLGSRVAHDMGHAPLWLPITSIHAPAAAT